MEKGVDAGQVPVVVYYPGMKGMGKVTMDDLKDPEKPLWDSDSSNRGLGGSQKAEVATLEHMGWDYREMDVTEFLHFLLPLERRLWLGMDVRMEVRASGREESSRTNKISIHRETKILASDGQSRSKMKNHLKLIESGLTTAKWMVLTRS